MANYNFRKDLKVAKKTEEQVAEYLTAQYGIKILEFEDTNKYDILADIGINNLKKFEVKEDFMCERTGNVAVEFECRGKPSGIQVCEADWYIYKIYTRDFGVQLVAHRTDELKKMIADKKYKRIVNGGDVGSNTMNYLFRYDDFVETGQILPKNDSIIY